MNRIRRTLTTLATATIGASLLTAPAIASAAVDTPLNPFTVTAPVTTVTPDGDGGMDFATSFTATLGAGAPARDLYLERFTGALADNQQTIDWSTPESCAPTTITVPGTYQVTCTGKAAAPVADSVEYVAVLEDWYNPDPDKWEPIHNETPVRVTYPVPVVEPPPVVVDPPVVGVPPVVEPPVVVDPPVVIVPPVVVVPPPVVVDDVVDPPVVSVPIDDDPQVDDVTPAATLTLKRAHRAFTVSLKDTTNTPIAGATVKVKALKGGKWKPVGTYKTNTKGLVKVKTKAHTKTKYQVTVVSVPTGFAVPVKATQTVTVKPAKKATLNR